MLNYPINQRVYRKYMLGWVALSLLLTGWGGMSPAFAAGTQKVITAVDSPPEPRKQIRMRYSRDQRRDNATISLRFLVKSDGRVEQFTIVKFSDPELIEPALDAYERARFVPAQKDGKPVDCWVEYEDRANE